MKKLKTFLMLLSALILTTLPSVAQNRVRVQGSVKDANGEPLIGAMVLVKGTQNGAMTDASGNYSISGVANGATLTASLLGYEEQSIKFTGQSPVDFALNEDKMLLEEAVAIGYGTQSKITLTGSVTSTTGAELVKNSSVNLSQGLAGRMSGVIVNNRSGEPGRDDPSIHIRGFSTFGTTTPLYIIDGVERDGMTRLNPDDIESITVLKDASAAIYGARAANGVILITTKKGQEGKTSFSVDFSTSFSAPTKIPEMLDAVTYSEVYNEGDWDRKGRPANYNPAIALSDIEKYRNGSDPVLYPNTDWVKETLRPYALQTRTSVQASGGTKNVRYLLSFGARTQGPGFYHQLEEYNQYTFRTNVEVDFSDYFTVGANISAILSNETHSHVSTHDNFVNILMADPRLIAVYPNGLIAPGRLGENPLLLDTRGYNKSWRSPIYSTFTATYKIPWVEGLRVDASFNYDISTSKNKVWSIPYFYHEYNVNTGEYDYKQGTGQSTVTLTDTYNYGTNMLYNYRITYDRYFGDHRVALMVGQEQQINQSSSAMARRQNFISTAIEEINVGSTAAEDKDNSGSSSKTARNNYFGRFNYEYASKYLLELLFRYDGSYKFPKDKRYGFFPAASFGWRISEEPFIKNNAPWINQLKLRASLGQTGNDAVSAYQYMQNYSFGGNFIFGTSTSAGIQPGTMPNPNITWERSTKYDLGLETTLWNGLLGAEITVFKEKRNNILTARNLSIPSTFGWPTTYPPTCRTPRTPSSSWMRPRMWKSIRTAPATPSAPASTTRLTASSTPRKSSTPILTTAGPTSETPRS